MALAFVGLKPRSRVEKQGKRGERPWSDELFRGLGLAGQGDRDSRGQGGQRELIKESARVNGA